jgi:hypothetical protein
VPNVVAILELEDGKSGATPATTPSRSSRPSGGRTRSSGWSPRHRLANFLERRVCELRRIYILSTTVNTGIKRAWLSSGEDRILRGFGNSALTTPVLFGGEALSPGGRSPLPYDQKRFAGV